MYMCDWYGIDTTTTECYDAELERKVMATIPLISVYMNQKREMQGLCEKHTAEAK